MTESLYYTLPRKELEVISTVSWSPIVAEQQGRQEGKDTAMKE